MIINFNNIKSIQFIEATKETKFEYIPPKIIKYWFFGWKTKHIHEKWIEENELIFDKNEILSYISQRKKLSMHHINMTNTSIYKWANNQQDIIIKDHITITLNESYQALTFYYYTRDECLKHYNNLRKQLESNCYFIDTNAI